MVATDKKSHRVEVTVAIIGLVGALGAALISNWDKVFSSTPAVNRGTHGAAPYELSGNTEHTNTNGRRDSSRQSGTDVSTTTMSTEPPRLYRVDWAYRYFKPCRGGTYNVIVKSLEGDQYAGISALRTLGSRFPDVAFRLVNTVGRDGESNQRFAIFAGCGLTRTDALKLVARVKEIGVASDAYTVRQEWDVVAPASEDWELMK